MNRLSIFRTATFHFYLMGAVWIGVLLKSASAQTLFVDAVHGNDGNPGTREKPLKTLSKSAEIINISGYSHDKTVKLFPGIHHLGDKALFTYPDIDHGCRLTIEAVIMPDDSNWLPDSMPVLLSTAIPSLNFGFDCSIGLDIEVNHAQIRGLKFLGNPVPGCYYYPVGRQKKNLYDLTVSQCLFIGDPDALPVQSGILAHGDSIKIDHCIFYNCKNSVVFYFADENREISRSGSSMSYCIVDGGYESGIWTASPDKDFLFHHNILTRCKYTWVHNMKNRTMYTISDCIITNNSQYTTVVTSSFEFTRSDITYTEKHVIKEGSIQLVKKNDMEMPVNYLHVVPGTAGSGLGAGLFIKKKY